MGQDSSARKSVSGDDGSSYNTFTEIIDTLDPLIEGAYGSDKVTNGSFAADTDWTKGTGWTIGSGVATCASATGAGNALSNSTALTSGLAVSTYYKVQVDVVLTSGTLYVDLGDNDFDGEWHYVKYVS